MWRTREVSTIAIKRDFDFNKNIREKGNYRRGLHFNRETTKRSYFMVVFFCLSTAIVFHMFKQSLVKLFCPRRKLVTALK